MVTHHTHLSSVSELSICFPPIFLQQTDFFGSYSYQMMHRIYPRLASSPTQPLSLPMIAKNYLLMPIHNVNSFWRFRGGGGKTDRDYDKIIIEGSQKEQIMMLQHPQSEMVGLRKNLGTSDGQATLQKNVWAERKCLGVSMSHRFSPTTMIPPSTLNHFTKFFDKGGIYIRRFVWKNYHWFISKEEIIWKINYSPQYKPTSAMSGSLILISSVK